MRNVIEHMLTFADGRTLHYYDAPPANGGDVDRGVVGENALTVVWLHGTPNLGEPPEPLFPAADERGIRFVSYDRPGYDTSTEQPGRTIASAVHDVAAIVDELGVDRFAVLGHSGGGPHALACAALLPERVIAAIDGSGTAPYGSEGLDFFAGTNPSGAASQRAAVLGREELTKHIESSDFDPEMFTPADHAALEGSWAWLGRIAGESLRTGLSGLIDDELAYVRPWGFDPSAIEVPVLICHGEDDRVVPIAHSRWLAEHIPGAEFRRYEGDGHVSVLESAAAPALDWILAHAR
jgi:pimeloyl-ACP methyl ester carboxylesterase